MQSSELVLTVWIGQSVSWSVHMFVWTYKETQSAIWKLTYYNIDSDVIEW